MRLPARPRSRGPGWGGGGHGGADLQAGGGERLHNPPHIQAELPDAATRAAPREHERVRLRSIGLEVAELRLGARAFLVPGLRGRQANGERRSLGSSPPCAPRRPDRRDLPAPTVPCCLLLHEAASAVASGTVLLTSGAWRVASSGGPTHCVA
jgi:hypothetical protein